MNERVQRALDGELPREDLSDAERREMGQAEQTLLRVVGQARATLAPDQTAAIMARIGAATVSPRRSPGRWRWLWEPRSIAVRPAWVLAAAAAILLLLVRPGSGPTPSAAPGMVLVHFHLDAPTATRVSLAGDFTDWAPTHALTRTESGTWSVVVPLTPGVHEYAFVVDGTQWRVDPMAPSVEDGFGGRNSRVAVLAPDVEAL